MARKALTSCLLILPMAFSPLAHAEEPASVTSFAETVPVGVAGDAADDASIVPGKAEGETRIVGTQKQGGLYVYDLNGAIVQSIPGGRPNNVDMRPDFPWAEGASPILATSDRTDNSVRLYRFDSKTLQVDPAPRAIIPSKFAEVYGVTIGRLNGAFVVVATSKTGEVAQWALAPSSSGPVAQETRRFALGSIAEGCVIDDDSSQLYVSQELEGLWRFPLDPAKGNTGAFVDRVAPNGHLAPDVEGATIWRGPNGKGYLIVSVQGESRFNVYDRELPNAYRGTFRIVGNASGTIDGVTITDGVEASSLAVSPQAPRGLLVVQDDDNTLPQATQDFKYVSWADVEAALGLNR
jgi:3-phytase